MIQTKKLCITKFYNFSRCPNFTMVVFYFDKVIIMLCTNRIRLSYNFIKFEMRCIRFVQNVTTAISDEEITNTKVVALHKLHNLVISNFLVLVNFGHQQALLISWIWILNFSNNLGWRNYLNESCSWQPKKNFIVDNFYIWIILSTKN